LQAAREALAERKIVEQAKTLLIKHRGMSEDEAHRILRKTAMDQGKRLIDVARAAIAMADMLGSKF
jgi:AmiR/NasT family two-component response regulator